MSSERNLIEAENIAKSIVLHDFLSKSEKAKTAFKEVNLDEIDSRPDTPMPTSDASDYHLFAYNRHPEPAQETPEERQYRYLQVVYENSGSYAENNKLAASINSLAKHNFTNRVLAAACDFKEMAENYPRSVFIHNFGPLIEEELKENPTCPSKRLASFATTYFWKEANWMRMVAASIPERHKTTTRDELTEFFMLPLNSEPNSKLVDFLPERVIGKILSASQDETNKTIKFDFRQNSAYIPLKQAEALTQSISELAQGNFTNRLLVSTSHYAVISNPFNSIRSIASFVPAIEKELKAYPDKPSATLVTMATEKGFQEDDVKHFIDAVKPETKKEELSEFFTVREGWSTGLRMIDYLNHYVVLEMARFLPEQDKLDLWSLRPEMINGMNVGGSLKKLSSESQKKLLDTITDPVRKKAIKEDMTNRLVGLRVSLGLMDGGNVNPDTLDILGQFADIRKRRICSHKDNRRFFHTHENYRSSY